MPFLRYRRRIPATLARAEVQRMRRCGCGIDPSTLDGNGVIADADAINGVRQRGKWIYTMNKQPDSRAKSAAGTRSGGQKAQIRPIQLSLMDLWLDPDLLSLA